GSIPGTARWTGLAGRNSAQERIHLPKGNASGWLPLRTHPLALTCALMPPSFLHLLASGLPLVYVPAVMTITAVAKIACASLRLFQAPSLLCKHVLSIRPTLVQSAHTGSI